MVSGGERSGDGGGHLPPPSWRRSSHISLLLDHQAGQLVQPGQVATAIMMSKALSVSGELMLISVAVRKMTLVSWTHVEARGLGSCLKMDCAPLADTCET